MKAETNYPLVSIIIPSFNRAELLPRAIESVIEQSYDNWELIIVDDGSLDTTEEIVKDFLKFDKRISYFKLNSNKGVSAARNKGMIEAKGTYINFLDSDDEFHPDKIAKQVMALESDRNAIASICHYSMRDEKNREIAFWHQIRPRANLFKEYLTREVFWAILSIMWRGSFIKENGIKFDESLSHAEDYEFVMNALTLNSKVIFLDESLGFVHIGPWSRISNTPKRSKYSIFKSRINILSYFLFRKKNVPLFIFSLSYSLKIFLGAIFSFISIKLANMFPKANRKG